MNSPNPTIFPYNVGKSSTGVKYIMRTPADSKAVSRFLGSKYTSPSPGVKETLSDRFIPVRACVNLSERFMAEETIPSTANTAAKNLFGTVSSGTSAFSTNMATEDMIQDEEDFQEAPVDG